MAQNKAIGSLGVMAASGAANAAHQLLVRDPSAATNARTQSARFDVLRGALLRIGSIFDVTDPYYGASPSATATFNTAAMQNAHADATAARGTVVIGHGRYAYNARLFDITAPVSIIGMGAGQTVLVPDASYSGYAIRFNNAWRSTSQTTTATTVNWALSNSRTILRGFTIAGDRTNTARGIEWFQINDQFYLENLELIFLNGRGLAFGCNDALGLCRESWINDVMVWRCGNSSEPAVDISTGASVGDQTNELHFMACKIVYPGGVGLKIWNNGNTGRTRRIGFVDLMLHGSSQISPQPAAHLCEITGNVDSIQFDNLRSNGSTTLGGTLYSCIHIDKDASGNVPADIKIDWHVSDCDGDALKVTKVNRLRVTGTAQTGSISGQELLVATDGIQTDRGLDYKVLADPTNRKITVNNMGDRILYLERVEVDGWFQDNVTASQTAVQLSRFGSGAFATRWIASRDYSIVGLWIKSNEVCTAGVATVEVYVNGVASGLTASLSTSATTTKRTFQALGLDRVAAFDEVDIRISTSAGWLPITADVRAGIVLA